jgi:hypothetical protein
MVAENVHYRSQVPVLPCQFDRIKRVFGGRSCLDFVTKVIAA